MPAPPAYDLQGFQKLAVDDVVFDGPAVDERGDDLLPVGVGLIRRVRGQSGDNGGTPRVNVRGCS